MQKTVKNPKSKSFKSRLLVIFTPKELVEFHAPFTWRRLLLIYVINNLLLYVIFIVYNYLTDRQVNFEISAIVANLLNNFSITLVLFILAVFVTFIYFVFLKFQGIFFSFLHTALGFGFIYLAAFFYKSLISLFFYILQQSQFLRFQNWTFLDIVAQYALSVLLSLYFLALIKANLVNRKKVLSESLETLIVISSVIINLLIFGP